MFGSGERQLQKESRYRSLVNRVEASAYGGEVIRVLDAVIDIAGRSDLGHPLSKFLRDSARAVSLGAHSSVIREDSQHSEENELPEGELLNAIDAAVSDVTREDFKNLAEFLANMSLAVATLENRSRFSIGARKVIREGVVERLRAQRQETKASFPTLEELTNELSSRI